MSILRKLIAVAAFAAFLYSNSPANAQGFGLGAFVTPTSASLNSPMLFTINVTNNFGILLNNIFVTNAISGAVNVIGATNTQNGTFTTGSNGIVFGINTLISGGIAQMTLSLMPTGVGPFTNQITVAAFAQPNATTSVIATVIPPVVDLAVGMSSATSGILVNDSTVIGLSVTNLGASPVPGVVLSNTLPASFKLLSVTPANVSQSFTNGNLVLNLGTIAGGSSTQLQVRVQPTNAGVFDLVAAVSAANFVETNIANSIVTNVMSVSNFLASALTVTEVPPQQFNPQTGLLEMNVLLQNTAATNVPAARVMVSGLTNGARLYNGIGTNNGAAYVLYNTNLNAGASVPLRLEFYVLVRSPMTNSYNLQAFAVPPINLSAGTNGVNASITNSSGGIMIEFAATPGKTYTIIYASDSTFSNALTAQPSIVAPANRVQWIDSGPPKTVSHPSTTPNRVYRVFQSQ